MERVKVVKGHVIKQLTREELNKELIEKGDWPLTYYVPGRVLNSLCITINKKKYRFADLEKLENFCTQYPKKSLMDKSDDEIMELMRAQ